MTVTRRGPAPAPPDAPIRLIGIDIDGTLLDSRSRLPERNRRAVRAAVDRGIHVVLVTGRAYHHALPIAREQTGKISFAHLSCAADGEGAEALHEAIVGVAANDVSAITAAIAGLDEIGHSSGWDALAGAVAVMSALSV